LTPYILGALKGIKFPELIEILISSSSNSQEWRPSLASLSYVLLYRRLELLKKFITDKNVKSNESSNRSKILREIIYTLNNVSSCLLESQIIDMKDVMTSICKSFGLISEETKLGVKDLHNTINDASKFFLLADTSSKAYKSRCSTKLNNMCQIAICFLVKKIYPNCITNPKLIKALNIFNLEVSNELTKNPDYHSPIEPE
jgi:hypothetical protein